MKTQYTLIKSSHLVMLFLFLLSGAVEAQLTYANNGHGTATITRYSGSGVESDVVIPSMTNGLLVTSIAAYAFQYVDDDYSYGITNISIPASVTNIGVWAFNYIRNLKTITVDTANPAYASVAGVLFNKSLTTLIQYPSGNTATSYDISAGVTNLEEAPFNGALYLTTITVDTANPYYADIAGVLFNKNLTTLIQYPCNAGASYTIPTGVTSIGDYAFWDWNHISYSPTSITIPNSVTNIGYDVFENSPLTSVTIPGSVTSIGDWAFYNSHSLTAVYFLGNAPNADCTVFQGDNVIVYYLPGTSGWSSTFTCFPTALLTLPYPLILSSGSGFGVNSNRFGFTIFWATNLSIIVEACSNLAKPVWQPLQTNSLQSGTNYFSDSTWTNYHSRFYRIRTP